MSDQVDDWSDMPGSQPASNTIYLKLPIYTMVAPPGLLIS